MEETETVEIETGEGPAAAVIWMHGLGSDMHDFEPVVPMLSLGPQRPVRYVFPNAPFRPVTLNGGTVMRAWYDLRSLEHVDDEDEAGLRSSAALIEGLIEREAERGIDPDKIVLAGFSQGGAIALFTALRYTRTLAGVVALSAYLPLGEVISQELHPANAKLPIFMAHGAIDDVVPIRFSRNSRKKLHQMGYEVSWWEYPVSHTVIPEELQQVKQFLSDVL